MEFRRVHFRSEIARRILRGCRALGLETIAVYSEADARAAHVEEADEARLIGPAPARDSYLKADRVLQVASDCRADAIHPGYGFLSENASFAEQVEAAGLRSEERRVGEEGVSTGRTGWSPYHQKKQK